MSAQLILTIIAISVPLNHGQDENEVGELNEAPSAHNLGTLALRIVQMLIPHLENTECLFEREGFF